MFTGIIEEIGVIKSVQRGRNSARLTISAKTILEDVRLGDSISVNGVCLTVTSFTKSEFNADVMHETMNRSSLKQLNSGSKVNLERAMLLGSRFGGHIVSGHIDGTGSIINVEADDNAVWYRIRADRDILRFIIEKGSIAIDGISLTVAKLYNDGFSVSIIPHSMENTILKYKKAGDIVNLENDCVGKYVARLMGETGFSGKSEGKKLEEIGVNAGRISKGSIGESSKKNTGTSIDMGFLSENGFL